MSGAETVLDVTVVFGALVNIFNHQANRSAGGDLLAVFIVKHTGKNFNRIRFAPLGGKARLARTAFIHEHLNFFCGNRNKRRAAIKHAA